MYNVFEIDQEGNYRQIGSDRGFAEERVARAYALLAATNWRTTDFYVVITAGFIVACYPGSGLKPTNSAALDEEEYLKEAA